MKSPNSIPDAPVYKAKIEEMDDLSSVLANAYPLAVKHGAVRIDPPEEWNHPRLRMSSKSQFFVRMQSLPEAPFMDSCIMQSGNTSNTLQAQTKKDTPIIVIDDDEDKDKDKGSSNKQTLNIPRHSNQHDHVHTSHKLDHATSNAGAALSPDVIVVSPNEPARKKPRPNPDMEVRRKVDGAGDASASVGIRSAPTVLCTEQNPTAGTNVSAPSKDSGNDPKNSSEKNKHLVEQERSTISSPHLLQQIPTLQALGITSVTIAKDDDVYEMAHPTDNQDEDGRLKNLVTFPDSVETMSLPEYEERSIAFEKKMVSFIGRRRREDKNWVMDADIVEEEFWGGMRKGIDGNQVIVAYGADVEAEGAFDRHELMYVGPNAKGKTDKRKLDNNRFFDLQAREELTKKTSNLKSCFGNLNRNGLLKTLPLMPGINHSMFYIGQLFTRFCWHVEDAFLESVSYLHRGSAKKVWYAVPPSFATEFETYGLEEVFPPDLVEKKMTAQTMFMNKSVIFHPSRLKKKGIEVFRVVHKPGSFVLTAARAYHAGFNCGFNIAEAVNYASCEWLPVGRQASYLARKFQKPLCIPLEYILFHKARAIEEQISAGKNISKREEKCASIVAIELEKIIREGEDKIREYATRRNCRVVLLTDMERNVLWKGGESAFERQSGIACSMCQHTCHFYVETCGSFCDNCEAKCPDHFGQGSELCSIGGHKPVIIRRYDPIILYDMLEAVEMAGGIESDVKTKLKRYKGYLRQWETPKPQSGLRMVLNLNSAMRRMQPAVAENDKLDDIGKNDNK